LDERKDDDGHCACMSPTGSFGEWDSLDSMYTRFETEHVVGAGSGYFDYAIFDSSVVGVVVLD